MKSNLYVKMYVFKTVQTLPLWMPFISGYGLFQKSSSHRVRGDNMFSCTYAMLHSSLPAKHESDAFCWHVCRVRHKSWFKMKFHGIFGIQQPSSTMRPLKHTPQVHPSLEPKRGKPIHLPTVPSIFQGVKSTTRRRLVFRVTVYHNHQQTSTHPPIHPRSA